MKIHSIFENQVHQLVVQRLEMENSLRQIAQSKASKQNSLLFDEDLWQILEKSPCASSDPSPGTQKPNTNASHYALHLVAC